MRILISSRRKSIKILNTGKRYVFLAKSNTRIHTIQILTNKLSSGNSLISIKDDCCANDILLFWYFFDIFWFLSKFYLFISIKFVVVKNMINLINKKIKDAINQSVIEVWKDSKKVKEKLDYVDIQLNWSQIGVI